MQQNYTHLIKRICQEKMLPQLMISISSKNLKPELSHTYFKSLKKKYKQVLRVPQIYQDGQQKSEVDKFIEKVKKIRRNEIPIQYLEIKKNEKGQNIQTFNGYPLEEKKIETKQQFQIFQHFSQENFKNHALDKIFQDKLQHEKISPFKISNQKKRYQYNQLRTNRYLTEQSYQLKQQQRIFKNKTMMRIKQKLPIIINETKRDNQILNIKSNNFMVQKLKVKKIRADQQQEVLKIFKKMKQLQNNFNNDQNSIQKQAISRYLKKYYQKCQRILSFLQIKQKITFEEFSYISKKIKLMPKIHFNFLAFLFYDTNNDGFICQKDLFRLYTLSKKHLLLQSDYKKMTNIRKYSNVLPNYIQLYSLFEITQNDFYHWLNSDKKINDNAYQQELILLSIKQKNYSINFHQFNQAFKDQKPMLWYEIISRFGGIKYQGLKYFQ